MIRRLFIENLGWKLLSLALAVLLWIVVVGRPGRFMESLPSQIRNLFSLEQRPVTVAGPPARSH